jgi:glycosyltransferase involved in cell wall biosynthesis
MRISSVFFEDLPIDLGRPPYPMGALNGRLLMTLTMAWAVANHPFVEEFAICGGDPRAVPGAKGLDGARLGAWLRAAPAVWYEPAQHHWWKAALIRQDSGVQFPIVTTLHGLSDGGHILPLLASLAAPSGPGDIVVAPSEVSATVLREQCRNLIDMLRLKRKPPEIVVIPYGIPPVVTTPRAVARNALGWNAEPVLLFIGRLTEAGKADFAALFEAVARLRAAGQAVRLVLAGACAPRGVEALRQHAWAAGIADAEVRANVSETEKHLLLSGCDVFVSPANTVTESFGLTVVEAMLHAVPVVCTDWNGYREIVRDGIDGLLVPTVWRDDAANDSLDLRSVLGEVPVPSENVAIDVAHLTYSLHRLLADPDLRRRFGAAAQTRASSRFLVSHAAAAVVTLMQEARAACPETTRVPSRLTVTSVFKRYASRRWNGTQAIVADTKASLDRLLRQGAVDDGAEAAEMTRLRSGHGLGATPDAETVFRWLRAGAIARPTVATRGTGTES